MSDIPVREAVPKREIALGFLNQVMIGRISEAFEKYIAREGFRHHNPYFRGDRESLKAAMMEAKRNFPKSTLEVKHVFEDANLIAVHSRVHHQKNTHALNNLCDKWSQFLKANSTSVKPHINARRSTRRKRKQRNLT